MSFSHFIADTHLSHANILVYEPARLKWGKTIAEHDDAIVSAWNATVPCDGCVLHLGDFAFGPRDRWAALRARLNGTIYIVPGNHDKGPVAMRQLGLDSCARRFYFECPELGAVVCRHDPSKFTGDDAEIADVLLHGHIHTNPLPSGISDEIRKKCVCVSVDVLPRAPAPVSMEELRTMIRAR